MGKKFNILIVDDEKNIREGLKKALQPLGYQIHLAPDGREGWFLLINEPIDLAILDLQMPKLTGIEVLKKMNQQELSIPVIFLTGHGNVDNAVEAMRLGAYDFLSKPTNIEQLELLIKKALNQKEVEHKNQRLMVQVKKFEVEKLIIGQSKAIRHLIDLIYQVAPSNANVLIYGESGTGKELICDAIHHVQLGDKPLIKVNCAALTPSLLESELFGHVRGSFTGADRDKMGRFEEANGGSLFLDEVSEIPQFVQVKLLRVLQERKIERVGSNKSIQLKIRLISASNKNLKEEVKQGRFREDLFYRLNVLDILVPPLRERKGDVALISQYLFKKFERENNKELEVNPQVFSNLENYVWPGNVRELSNVIEKMVVLCKGSKISVDNLPLEIRKYQHENDVIQIRLGVSMQEIEDKVIAATIRYCNGNKTKAAKMLNIGRKTIYRKQQHP